MEDYIRVVSDDEGRAFLHYYVEIAGQHLGNAEKEVDVVGLSCHVDMAAHAFLRTLYYSVKLRPVLAKDELADVEAAKQILLSGLEAAKERLLEKVNAQ